MMQVAVRLEWKFISVNQSWGLNTFVPIVPKIPIMQQNEQLFIIA